MNKPKPDKVSYTVWVGDDLVEVEAKPIEWLKCTWTVELRRGDEPVGMAFVSGHVYPVIRMEYGSRVMINEFRSEHLVGSYRGFDKMHFDLGEEGEAIDF